MAIDINLLAQLVEAFEIEQTKNAQVLKDLWTNLTE